METARILKIISLLKQGTIAMRPLASELIKQACGSDPFFVLVGCILSLRTKDAVSFSAACRLLEQAKNPEQLRSLDQKTIELLIYPVGFYRQKARQLRALSNRLITDFNAIVPNNIDALLTLEGVGRKTANLVLAEGFGIPALCVDTHVHRIANRLGLVCTKTPQETEFALKSVAPPETWIDLSRLLVMWGQNVCVPISPFCSRCVLAPICPQIGVKKSR